MAPNVDVQSVGLRLTEIARRQPHHVAIIEGGTSITYGALEGTATAIARRIARISEGRPGAACLFFESKLRAITSIFGAARSGRPYVPLDAGDPEERLRFIVDDSQPIALLTEASLAHRARDLAPSGCAVVVVEDVQQEQDEMVPLPVVASDAMLYLHYTSGSTGRPKGVTQTHGNLSFFVDTYADALRIGTGDRMSLLYTMSFAAANSDVFRALLHGATLCAYDMRGDGIAQLADWLDRERITLLHIVTTAFREMAARLAPGRLLPHLRAVHLGGESAFATDIGLFRERTLDQCVLLSQLASTEAGLVAQKIIDHRNPATTSAVLSVGRCIDGVRIEIRRDDDSIAGIDEVGEVIVSSRYLSPGYWRRPDLDAASFFTDASEPDTRRYRSGDYGRIDGDGELHLHGRKGGRIKVRGHSVDVAEIEAALATCPNLVKTAIAVAVTDDDSPMRAARLVAYVVPRDRTTRDPQAIRRHLAAKVPRYMWPAAIVYLDALPMTPSGKIDRYALAQIGPANDTSVRSVDPLQDDIERAIGTAFEAVLKVARVGRDDDFFLLGGDSLAGVELQQRLSEAFGVPVGHWHADATVSGIAARIRRAIADPAARSRALPVLIPLWRNGREPPLFLVHGRHGQAFVSPHFMQLLGDEQPMWAFQARGLDGLREPHASVEDMAAEYLGEMRKQHPHGPYFLGSLCAGVYIVAIMARTLRDAGETVLPLLLLDPPNSVMQPGYAQLTEEQFFDKMKARSAKRRSSLPSADPAYMQSVLRTATAFEHAIAVHRPPPYDGPVYVLSSRQRSGGNDAQDLRRIFTGRVKRYEVGTTHAQSLDPRNPVFASALKRCVGLIRESARQAPHVAWESRLS
jgi:amino acid adenylation domain-containing protein